MSFTVSEGLVDERYWAFLAAEMDEILTTCLSGEKVDFKKYEGALTSARKFINLVIEAQKMADAPQVESPKNLMAYLSTYAIAVEALAHSAPPKKRQNFEEVFNDYSEIIGMISTEGSISSKKKRRAEELRKVFSWVWRKADSDNYNNYVEFNLSNT